MVSKPQIAEVLLLFLREGAKGIINLPGWIYYDFCANLQVHLFSLTDWEHDQLLFCFFPIQQHSTLDNLH